MSEISNKGVKIRHFIKARMKMLGLKYSDLAGHLSVSLPTVKRILNSEDIPLERLISISDFLRLSIEEFFTEFSTYRPETSHFTKEQEEFLGKNPSYLYLLILLSTRKTLEDVCRDAPCSMKTLKKRLFKLDRAGFIDLREGGKFSLKVRIPFRSDPNGPISSGIIPLAIEELRNISSTQTRGVSKEGEKFFSAFEMYLSHENLKAFCKELESIWIKYQKISNLDSRTAFYPNIVPVAGLFNLEEHDIWGKVTRKSFPIET